MIPDLPPQSTIQDAIPQLSESVAVRAQSALLCARAAGQKVSKFVIFDASRDASDKRLFVLDVAEAPRLLLTDWVAHGSGSDRDRDGRAERFSNTPNSNATSLGLYRVSERYQGKNPGWSYRLDGLTPGFNDNARKRAVVIHASNYVSPDSVGRSWGCPAVRPEIMQRLDKLGMQDTMLWIDAEGQGLDAVAISCPAAQTLAAQMNKVEDPFAHHFAMTMAANAERYSLTCQAWTKFA